MPTNFELYSKIFLNLRLLFKWEQQNSWKLKKVTDAEPLQNGKNVSISIEKKLLPEVPVH